MYQPRAAGDGDLTQVEALTGAASTALDHHQAGLGRAQPARGARGMLMQGRFEQPQRRPGQQRHPLRAAQGAARSRVVKGLKHGSGTLKVV